MTHVLLQMVVTSIDNRPAVQIKHIYSRYMIVLVMTIQKHMRDTQSKLVRKQLCEWINCLSVNVAVVMQGRVSGLLTQSSSKGLHLVNTKRAAL